MSTIRSQPTIVRIVTMPGCSATTCADPRGLGALGQRTHRGQHRVGGRGRDDRDELALVGHVERVQAEQLARGPDRARDRDRRLVERPCPRWTPAAISLSADGEAAARGVAQHVDVGLDRERSPRPGRRGAAVSEAISTSNSSPSRTLMIATPWRPIGPDRMTASPGRRAVRGRGARRRGTTPMPAVFTNSLSAAPRPTTLVSPVTISAPACRRGRGRGRRDRRAAPRAAAPPRSRRRGRARRARRPSSRGR